MDSSSSFWAEHRELSRRFLLQAGALLAGAGLAGGASASEDLHPELRAAIDQLEPYFTPAAEFRDVSRGKPIPHTLPEEKRREVGLTRDTWKLEVIADPESPATLRKPLSVKTGTALDFQTILNLGAKKTVRFAKVMTCLNIGCPLGTGIWEGVPLRDVLWLTQPKENLRRVMYHGFHNDDPKQLFRSSLPVGRVLEDYNDLPPVILCYKLNGEWLSPERGGPVRIVVPEAYGFKSVKWLTHVVLSNQAHSNDTYANGNNDIDSPLKTFAATLQVPSKIRARQMVPITGYAQVGISGLKKVQVWVSPKGKPWPADDPYFTQVPWQDAQIVPPPARWGGDLPGKAIPAGTIGFDAKGQPKCWPMRLTKVHWAALLPGLEEGAYILRCRTVDDRDQAQPMPRPFKKSGRCDIEEISLTVSS